MDKLFAILRLVGIALAIVTAFATVPYVAPILLVLGLVASIDVKPDDSMRIYAAAILLNLVPKAFDVIPTVGSDLNDMLSSFGLVYAGVAVGVVAKGLYTRVKGDWIK